MGMLINSEGKYLKIPIDSLAGEFLTVSDINVIDTSTKLRYNYGIGSANADAVVSYNGSACCDRIDMGDNYVGRYYSVSGIVKVCIYDENLTKLNSTDSLYAGIKSFEIDENDNLIFYSADNDVVSLSQELSGTPKYFRTQWLGAEGTPFTITKGSPYSENVPYSYKDVDFNTPYKGSLVSHIFESSQDLSEMIIRNTRPLYGKVLVMFGDSEMQYLHDYSDNIQMYKDILGISAYRSYAVAGKAWETTEETETDPTTATLGIHAQFNTLLSDISGGRVRKEDIGAIVWMMGTNGFVQGNFWETENSVLNTDIRTMCGAAHTFMKRVLLEFTDPDVRLLGIIPIQGANRNEFFSSEYMARHNLIRDIHRCWSIPFLDLQYEGEVVAKNVLNCDNGTLGDTVHWSKLGMQIGIRKICGKLITI